MNEEITEQDKKALYAIVERLSDFIVTAMNDPFVTEKDPERRQVYRQIILRGIMAKAGIHALECVHDMHKDSELKNLIQLLIDRSFHARGEEEMRKIAGIPNEQK